MILNWVKKLWNSVVFSKVIATLISAIIIGLFVFIMNKIGVDFNSITEFLLVYYRETIIIILAILLIIFLILFIKEKRKNISNKNIKIRKRIIIDKDWLIKKLNNELNRYMFLIWLPIHNQMSIELQDKISDDDKNKLLSLKTINDLQENNIINIYRSQWSFSISITDDVYTILKKYIDEYILSSEENKQYINNINGVVFETALIFHICTNDYNNLT